MIKFKTLIKNKFFQKIVVPATIALLLFIVTVFAFILPAFERNAINQKKNMLKELTATAWSILDKYNKEYSTGKLGLEAAQSLAKEDIEALRYGTQKKDYFWITDMEPNMLMHPYMHELTGTPLQNYADPDGKKLFIEAVEIAKKQGEGFISYKWQFMDDSSRIVPKLSYVKKFEPWKWIIGTGIYLDDVQTEIARLRNQLLIILLLSTLLIATFIAFATWQSLLLENKRLVAEEQLRISQERYRALVEASSEGALLVLHNYIYANKTLLNMLDYDEYEIEGFTLWDIIASHELQEKYFDFETLYNATELPESFESFVTRKNQLKMRVMVNLSRITMTGNKALVVLIKEIPVTGQSDADSVPLNGESLVSFDFANFGFFRSSFSRNSRFTEATQPAVKILGFRSKEEMMKTRIDDLFADKSELKSFTLQLLKYGFVNNKVLRLFSENNKQRFVAVWAILHKNSEGGRYCEGFVQDVSDAVLQQAENNVLVADAMNRNAVLLLSVIDIAKAAPVCNPDTPVTKAAYLMTVSDSKCIFVQSERDNTIGMVTDADIRSRWIESGRNFDKTTGEIMTAPVIAFSAGGTLFDALLTMQKMNIDVLPVRDDAGNIRSYVSGVEIVARLANSGDWIIRSVNSAAHASEFAGLQFRLRKMVELMFNAGIHARYISPVVSQVSDAVIARLGDLIICEIGQAPANFAFLVFGSVGRNEQSLATDQDNALVYADADDEREQEAYAEYYNTFARKMNEYLIQCGYRSCKGGYMACNAKWCRPLSEFRNYFNEWINKPVPQNLLEAEVFFDFRLGYGNQELAETMKNYMLECMLNSDPFFYQMAANTASIKLPTQISGTIDIKKMMLPLVNIVRLYALKAQLSESNTFQRIAALHRHNHLATDDFTLLIKTYDFLLKLRLQNQLHQLSNGRVPDNLLEVSILNDIELQQVKQAVSAIQGFYTRLNYDFKHAIG
ncbi:MAG TPA: DUF294 nucleotidyltransferase-like domain-containing protein [Bacteroidales bacterium]|nr:DUF294 nucleotidyltransferase-like domain-containing protein [Bacteroidales bacterium]